MQFLDPSTASIWSRLLAATICFIVLGVSAGGCIMVSMLMFAFSMDGASPGDLDESLFNRTACLVVGALLIGSTVPPVMILFRSTWAQAAIPCAVGFLVAGVTVFWYLLTVLGGN